MVIGQSIQKSMYGTGARVVTVINLLKPYKSVCFSDLGYLKILSPSLLSLPHHLQKRLSLITILLSIHYLHTHIFVSNTSIIITLMQHLSNHGGIFYYNFNSKSEFQFSYFYDILDSPHKSYFIQQLSIHTKKSMLHSSLPVTVSIFPSLINKLYSKPFPFPSFSYQNSNDGVVHTSMSCLKSSLIHL